MDFFDKHKALIITSLLCSVLVLALYNLHLSDRNRKAGEFLVDLEQFEEEEEISPEEEQEEQEQEEEQTPNEQTRQTHRAYDQDEEAREKNFDNELNEILNRNSASQTESASEEDNASEGEYAVQKREEETRERSDGNDTSEEISTKSGGIDNSSIQYSLKGRRAIEIPNPVYTCDLPGKVVVNIRVNAEGRVTGTSINKGSSSTTNQCLTERALEYAAGAIFSELPGRNSQPGTITYYFKP